MKKLSKAINVLKLFAAIPDYPKCKKCGNADPYLDDDGLCYKCFDSNSPKNPTLPSPAYDPEDTPIDHIIKKNGLIPYLKTRTNYMCILPPFHLIPTNSVSITNAQSKLKNADPKLMEKIIDNAALSGAPINNEIRLYCVQFDVASDNNNITILLTPITDDHNVLHEYQILKNDLAPIVMSDDLNKIGVPNWFIRAFKHMSNLNPVNFLKSII